MKNVIAKITGAGNPNVLVTERGVSFGYNTLVSDMRSLPIMAGFGARWCSTPPIRCSRRAGRAIQPAAIAPWCPIWRGPRWRWAWPLSSMEVHQDPDHAPSDGPNMVKLKDFPALLMQLVEIDAIVKR